MHYVYGLFECGVCIYVGRTISPSRRKRQHRRASRGVEFRIFREFDDGFKAIAK
jgi:hypothetical protein